MRTFITDRTCWSLLLTELAIILRYKPIYDKLRVLIINKDVRKSLARKNGNENPVWSWNDSVQKCQNVWALLIFPSGKRRGGDGKTQGSVPTSECRSPC